MPMCRNTHGQQIPKTKFTCHCATPKLWDTSFRKTSIVLGWCLYGVWRCECVHTKRCTDSFGSLLTITNCFGNVAHVIYKKNLECALCRTAGTFSIGSKQQVQQQRLFEANNDTYCLQNQREKFPLVFTLWMNCHQLPAQTRVPTFPD